MCQKLHLSDVMTMELCKLLVLQWANRLQAVKTQLLPVLSFTPFMKDDNLGKKRQVLNQSATDDA